MLLTMQGHMGAGRAFSGTSLLPQVIKEHWNTNRKEKELQSDLKLDSVLHLKTSCLYNRIPAQLIPNPGSRQHSDRLSTFRAQLAPSCQHKDHMLEEQQKDFFHQHPFSTGGTGKWDNRRRQRIICARLRDVQPRQRDPSLDAFQAQPAVPRHI